MKKIIKNNLKKKCSRCFLLIFTHFSRHAYIIFQRYNNSQKESKHHNANTTFLEMF